MDTPAIVVAGVSSGVGKTTVALGLMQALRDTGLKVQPLKVGPDFLDPCSTRPRAACPRSRRLDARSLCLPAVLCRRVRGERGGHAIVEGVMGLHDGLDGRRCRLFS